MTPEEKAKSVGLKEFKNENGEDCCQFCNYMEYEDESTKWHCNLLKMRFSSLCHPADFVCKHFDGDEFDSIIAGFKGII